MNVLERIVREHGPCAVSYEPQNEEMEWTVSMLTPHNVETVDPVTGEKTGNVVRDWHDHEHGATLEETAQALYEQLKRQQ